jgi:hypothetical protein
MVQTSHVRGFDNWIERLKPAIPAPPNVDSRINPSKEQLAHALESTLTVELEKKDARFIFKN